MAARLLSGELRGLARMGAAVAVRRMSGSHMMDEVLDRSKNLFSGMGRPSLKPGDVRKAAQ